MITNYSLTEHGQKRALSHQKVCSYTGPAPVPLMDYVLSVEAQASHFSPITRDDLLSAISAVTYEKVGLICSDQRSTVMQVSSFMVLLETAKRRSPSV